MRYVTSPSRADFDAIDAQIVAGLPAPTLPDGTPAPPGVGVTERYADVTEENGVFSYLSDDVTRPLLDAARAAGANISEES